MAKRTKALGASAPGADTHDAALADSDKTVASKEVAPVADAAHSTEVAPVAGGLAVDSAGESEADTNAEPVPTAWPVHATLRNNSAMQLVEPATGRFLFPFSSDVVEVRDQDHANEIESNMRSLDEINGLGGALTVDGLPVL